MGSSPAGTQESIKFGKDFEVDLRASELRRSGHNLKLERIPLQVLLLAGAKKHSQNLPRSTNWTLVSVRLQRKQESITHCAITPT